MKIEITDRAHLELLIKSFYEKALNDATIGFFFTEVSPINWTTHLPKIVDFWEDIAFQTKKYSGNPIAAHVQIHEKSKMTAQHFTRWTDLFTETIDELFIGEKATLIKQRALSIAVVMQTKLYAHH